MQTQMKVTKATAKAPIDWVNPSYRATPPVQMTFQKMPIRLRFEPHEISPREILSSRRALFLKECHKMLDEIRKSVSQRPVFHSFNSNSSNHYSFRRHRHHSFHRSKM